MRRRVQTWEVAHLWAAQSQDEARNGRNFYFTGDTIYSYGSHFPIARIDGSHFPIARIVIMNGRKAVLFTSHDYSATTAKHKSVVRYAICRGQLWPIFVVPSLGPNPDHRMNLAHLGSVIHGAAIAAARAKCDIEWKLKYSHNLVRSANEYAEFFGLRTRFKAPSKKSIAEQIAKERSEAAKKAAETRRLNTERRKRQAVDDLLEVARSARGDGPWNEGPDVDLTPVYDALVNS